MQRLTFTNSSGDSIVLGPLPYGLTSVEGLGIPAIDIEEQEVPDTDGTIYSNGTIPPREIELTVALCSGNDLSYRYELRRDLVSVLNPKLGEGTLLYENDYISRQITCVCESAEFANKNANDTDGSATCDVTFYCALPFWEDTAETTVSLTSGSSYTTVTVNGDVEVPVTISIVGTTAVDPYISELVQGLTIEYDETLSATLNISTYLGEKTMLLGTDNVLQYMSTDSTLEFYLQPGTNRLLLNCTSGSATATVTYRNRYVGL